MIVKKEKMSTKIKNYFKNIFSKIVNQGKKKKNKSKGLWPRKQEEVPKKQHFNQQNERIVEEHKHTEQFQPRKPEYAEPAKINKEITIEVTPTKRKPKEIVIEYENRNKPKKKQIVVEYEKKKKKVHNAKLITEDNPEPKLEIKNEKQKEVKVEKTETAEKTEPVKTSKIQLETKKINVEVKPIPKKKAIEKKKEEPELALKPVKPKREKKPLNIFQLFKDKERKKRKEILNRIRENKVDDYETISTKAKLSKGSIAVDDVDAHELDPLIDLYRDSNKKLRNRIKESQK